MRAGAARSRPGNTSTAHGNHDRPRVGDRVGTELMNAFNLIGLTLPGVTITYQVGPRNLGMRINDLSGVSLK